MSRYAGLNRAQLSYDYLHTNSTTHEFLFGALVEMVDNSKDSGAQACAIYTMVRSHLRGGRILCFLDDGGGMTPDEAQAVMTFGYSAKRTNPEMIGQYGNGLKSGAMRIGKDLMVFTKKGDRMTCVFLSRTFHDEEGIEEIIVPSPAFSISTKQPIIDPENPEKHALEMDIILRYSPFRTVEEFREQFNKIKNDGTLVMVYNLKLTENGRPELDFESDPYDIHLSDPDGGGDNSLVPQRSSLRAYLSVLYNNPSMKLYINGNKVRTKRMVVGLYKPRQYSFASNKFRLRAEQQIQEVKELTFVALEKKKEAEMRLKDFERQNNTTNVADKEMRTKYRLLQDESTMRKAEYNRLKANEAEKISKIQAPKSLTFMFGMYLENRSHDGCFIYNNGRLIKMYEKVGAQKNGGVMGLGVVGMVDVPFTVMEPTHNKQDFADNREYRELLRSMGEHLDQYWRDLDLAAQPGGLAQFWEGFGYNGCAPDRSLPSMEEKFVKKRMMNVNIVIQCDMCLKWRKLNFDSKYLKDGWPPDTWKCSMNPDSQNNNCNRDSEKVIDIPKGQLKRVEATVEEKRELLQKRIDKQQAEVAKLAGLSTVRSRRDMQEAERKRKEAEEADKAKALAEAEAARKAAAQKKRPAPALPPASNHASTSKGSRKRKSPSPPPAAKKPRTKAELRKQMIEKRRRESEKDDEEDSEEEDVEQYVVLDTSPIRRRGGQPPVSKPSSPPKRHPPPAASKKTLTPPSRNVAYDQERTPAVKKVVQVQREEAHSSTTNGEHMAADSDDQSSSTTMESTSTGKGGRSTKPTTTTMMTKHGEDGGDMASILEEKLRNFIFYFTPPEYKFTKLAVKDMSLQDILAVDTKDFCESYERKITTLLCEKDEQLSAMRKLCVRFVEASGLDLSTTGVALPDGIEEVMKKYLESHHK